MRVKIRKEAGTRLRKLRRQLGYSISQMATQLGITVSTYSKNEKGENFPSEPSLKILTEKYDISMDWLIFEKGPMYNKEKEIREKELEQKVKELTAELEQERQGRAAQCKKLEEDLDKKKAEAAFIESRPEVKELLEYMEKSPVFYHEFMLYFQKYKIEKEKTG